jgi:hypothetical protein
MCWSFASKSGLYRPWFNNYNLDTKWPNSYAIDSLRPSSANLVLTYAEESGRPTRPANELMLIVVPLCCFLICGSTDCVTLNRPNTSLEIIMNQRINDFENICIKCGKKISDHPRTGRFNTVVLFGHECAWNPDS